jgi:RHS repeat-associated protein
MGVPICTTWLSSRSISIASRDHYRFTGKERDSESGLDYFINRHYGSSLGRFMQPDPIFFQAEMLTDPQRFNQYAYVRNNPLALVDPKGEAIELTCSSTDANTCASTAPTATPSPAASGRSASWFLPLSERGDHDRCKREQHD